MLAAVEFTQASKGVAFLALLGLAFSWAVLPFLQKRRQKSKVVDSAPDEPLFQTPLPTPLENFDLGSKEPQPYRPFRHGTTHVTMGIRKLDWDNWIEIDSNYLSYHDLKVSELNKDLAAHVGYVDNADTRDACFEIYEELTQYLCHRYPKMFQLKDGKLNNLLTSEVFPYPAATPTDALATSAKLIQDDIVLMVKEDDGQYHVDAAAVCLPGFWRLKEKFRMSLDELHIEAGVPHYQTKLQKSMNRFFQTMRPEKPVTRNNFFIQLDDGLHWSHRMGDQKGNEVASWATANSASLTVDELHFRSERQTLRRLPRSKAIVFTIRTYFEPIPVIAKEPHVPGRLAEAIRNWDESMSHYKGKTHWDKILLPYLDEQHEKQMESGILEKHPEAEFPY
ncbi:Uu.00g030700.m01.CDS01 [Anthostomella pinea]|uniref:Uu.00g030700.m01.CDS01 n=1 Tax=Anthostomella pinea TaxID=933095 RepID=A0AAI8V8Y4_9PEZI|nr:Uu.00g030700.m01.CDS01 [Anthostomella pinea]